VSFTALELARRWQDQFGPDIRGPIVFRDEVTLEARDPQRLVEVCTYARHRLELDFLVDICGLDDLGQTPRFILVYQLYSYSHRAALRLKTRLGGDPPELPSVTGIWPGANWLEREVFDMLGIRFRGHPNLQRILMWEGYPYFPLRKDFPLAGLPSDAPGVAFSRTAPQEGGPFVAAPGGQDATDREPRSRESS